MDDETELEEDVALTPQRHRSDDADARRSTLDQYLFVQYDLGDGPVVVIRHRENGDARIESDTTVDVRR
ncbi:hypothetical protein ACFPYI_04175 [Halomarina salina]|uniref:Halobacterial output domain-containing protein n=1 Tax=Halomarina salina TaxID=1872699 RepID=A0ABD5RJ87_9EURY|nr:hypothetical protein [Halomarina salina]